MATMIEHYDTPMNLDFSHDDDVTMQSTSLDSWYHDASMDHDQLMPSQKHTQLDPNITVEVDMEPYEEETVEYEMADEENPYQNGVGDLADVEIFESQTQSPVAILHDLDPPPVSGNTDPTHTSSISQPLAAVAIESQLLSTEITPEEYVTSSPRPTAYEEFSGVSDPAVNGNEEVDLSHLDIPPIQHDASEVVSSAAGSVDNPDDSSHHDAYQVELSHEYVADTAEISYHHEHSDLPPSHETIPHDEAADSFSAEPHTEEHADDRHPVDSPEEYHDEHGDQSAVGVEVPPKDPHEISDGVYIDPPPAVLICLPSSDQAQISLFNYPSQSGSATPSRETTNPEELTLLLRGRPTLYYEPLNSVFEALRQEDYITSNPAFIDGELVLDAYDLQLIVSEDNVYAREVTLHDLNVLHDGSDIFGPLRLKLRTVVPRFIARYHALQEQIARLNLAVEAEDGYVEGEGADEYYPEDTEHHDPEAISEHQENPAQEVKDQQAAPEETTVDLSADLPATDHGDLLEHERPGPDPETEHLAPDDKPSTADVVEPEPAEEYLEYPAEDHENAVETNADENPEVVDAEVVRETETTEVYADANADSIDPVGSEYIEYEEYVETSEEYGDDGYTEAPSEDGAEPAEPDVINDSVELPEETHLTELSTPHATELVLASDAAEHNIGNEHDNVDSGNYEEQEDESEGYELLEHVRDDTPFHIDLTDNDNDDLLVPSEHATDLTDTPLQPSNPDHQIHETTSVDNYDDQEWDDTLDGEGDLDTTWEEDQEPEQDQETQSNESSVTLSSKASSSKRSFDEVEPEEGNVAGASLSSPESKKLRVQ